MNTQELLRMSDRTAVPGTTESELMELYSKVQNSEMPYDRIAELRAYAGPKITAEQLAEEVPQNKRSHYRILDVGAGTGLVAEELTKLGFFDVDALEPSPDMLKKAKEKAVYNQYFQMFLTGEPVPINDSSYNAVVTCGSFMENHIQLEAIPELLRIVKPVILKARIEEIQSMNVQRANYYQTDLSTERQMVICGIIVITTRYKYLDTVEAYRGKLQPFFDYLENRGKWLQLQKMVFPKYTNEDDGIVWKYIVQ